MTITFEVDLSVLARWLSARWDEFDSICAATPVDDLSVFWLTALSDVDIVSKHRGLV